MNGFKNFILRGNLVDLAVAVIIGTSFGLVVASFTKALTSMIPGSAMKLFSDANPWGAFVNATIAFVILAAVVYLFVVLPYTRAREKYFPEPAEDEKPADVALLEEIRDLLAKR